MAKKLEGYITFIHFGDGKEYHFVTKENPLTGNQMYSWDSWRVCCASDKKDVRSIIRKIFKKATKIIATDLK